MKKKSLWTSPSILSLPLLFFIYLLFDAALAPPKLVSEYKADPTVFNGENAYNILRELIPQNLPHPVGSIENKRVRDRIAGKLKEAGYLPEIQADFVCGTLTPACADIENIIVRLPGVNTGNNNAILLMAHYDSTPATPGAGDDMAAVAALIEVASRLQRSPTYQNDIIFLFTDGEEVGLLGATGFVHKHPLFSTVKLVFNFEGRGASGPSMLFETGKQNGHIIRQFSKASQAPHGNSFFYEVYKNMPNDTDFSIFRNEGVSGLNFAFGGHASHYHSAIDKVENISPNSIQHHGQNAMDAISAFGNSDLNALHSEDRVFFDIFSMFFIHWSVSTSWALIILAFTGFILVIWSNKRRNQLRLGFLLVSMPLGIFMIMVFLIGGWLLTWPLADWPLLEGLDHADPAASRLSLLFFVFVIGLMMSSL
ncbi:MAG: M28 family peptidase, partial [Kordiimonas sp.]